MSSVRELHGKATELAQLAVVARDRGELAEGTDFARQALRYECAAAELIPDDRSSEPTRSIFYLSAASLAYQSRELETAGRLVAKGLAGHPPPRIAEDLRQLYEQLGFESHLEEQGIVLEEEDLEVSMVGETVGSGTVLYLEFRRRIDQVLRLLFRRFGKS